MDPSDDDDVEFLRRWNLGDRRAGAMLIERHSRLVVRSRAVPS
jgi:hypothetical protein